MVFIHASFPFSCSNTCFSEVEEKGSDCIPQFRAMQECFEKYPEEYGKYADSDDTEEGSNEETGEGRTEKGEGEGAASKDQEQAENEKGTEGEQTPATAEISIT